MGTVVRGPKSDVFRTGDTEIELKWLQVYPMQYQQANITRCLSKSFQAGHRMTCCCEYGAIYLQQGAAMLGANCILQHNGACVVTPLHVTYMSNNTKALTSHSVLISEGQ